MLQQDRGVERNINAVLVQESRPKRIGSAMSVSDGQHDGDAERLAEHGWRIVHEHGPEWWNDYRRRFPNSKVGERSLREEMAHHCVVATLRETREEIENLIADTSNDAGCIQAYRESLRQVFDIIGISRGNDHWPQFVERLRAEIARLRSTPAARVVEAARKAYLVERLSGITDWPLEQALAEYDAAPADAKEDAAIERRKIVAWLRKEANQPFDQSVFATGSDRHLAEMCFKMLALAADAIERGEHASGEEGAT
jgi:hypothetical protein